MSAPNVADTAWIERAIAEILNADAVVTSIAGDRVSPDGAHQGAGTSPSIVVLAERQTYDEGFCGPTRTVTGQVIIEASAASRGRCRQLAFAALRALVDFDGLAGGLDIQAIHADESEGDFEKVDDGSDQDRYVTSETVTVIYDVPDAPSAQGAGWFESYLDTAYPMGAN